VIPNNRINPVSAAMQQYFPNPTSAGNPFTGLNNFFFTGPFREPYNDYSIRIDHQWSPKYIMTGRYSYHPENLTPPHQGYGPKDLGDPSWVQTQEHYNSAVAKLTATFSPTMFGEFVSSWNRWWFFRLGVSNGFDPTQLGFPPYLAANSRVLGFPPISIDSMSSLGYYPSNRVINDRGEIKANFSKIVQKHTFKFGALFDLGKIAQSTHNNSVGSYSFTRAFTQGPNPLLSSANAGFGYATFLLGTISSGSQNVTDVTADLTEKYLGFYFQDEYKITPHLTLNLGVRYDVEFPRTELMNRTGNFNFSGTATLPNGVPVRGGLAFPGVGGLPGNDWNSNPHNVAPRIGFAYSLGDKTVVRGGYGIFYANSNAGGGPVQTGFTCSTSVNSSLNGGLNPNAYLSDPFPTGFCKAPGSSAGLLTNLGTAIPFVDRNEKVPYGESWNLDIQRKLPGNVVFDIAYSGSRGIHLIGQLEYDNVPSQYMQLGTQLNSQVANPFYGVITSGPLAGPTIPLSQALRPYPQFLSVESANATYGASTYHAMFLRVERRFSKGFSVLASYTLSKLIDDVQPSPFGFPGDFFATDNLQDMNNRRNERALASFDTPHTLVLSYIYELPFGPGKALLNRGGVSGKIFGGWQINGITEFQSGSPLGITGGNSPGVYTPDAVGGTVRPNWSGMNATLSGPIQQRLAKYFDTSQFSFNAPFTFGNAPRTMPNLRAPGINNFNLSLVKNTHLTEKFNLQFRAEAFNAMNRVQFQIPDSNFNSPTFGRITAQTNTPRDIQLALKLQF
jgi:hypothetical protein